jgi:DNA polymerase III delta prime subunit
LKDISRKILLGAAASGRIPNAYLFVGTDSKSLLDEAAFFARVLNCTSKGAHPCVLEEEPCEDCGKIKKSVHPDLLILSSDDESIKINDIRQISEYVKYGPAGSGWKVIVINGADRMTEEASNSFLKTLEEPLKNILFILTTVRESKVLKTIASRCQKLIFYSERPASGEGIDELTDKILKVDEMSIPQMLRVSEELSFDPDVEEKLNSVLYNFSDKLGYGSGKKILAAREIFNALRAIERNGNKRLALDSMFISLQEEARN